MEGRSLRLRLQEGGHTFELLTLKDGVRFHNRDDILLCRCDRPLILPASYSPTGQDEGSDLCAVADRFVEGSLLGPDRLPAMVNVLAVRTLVEANTSELADGDATFAFTGVVSDA